MALVNIKHTLKKLILPVHYLSRNCVDVKPEIVKSAFGLNEVFTGGSFLQPGLGLRGA